MVRDGENNPSPTVKPGPESTSTTPAIVVVCLGATLFLVGIVTLTSFFFRRKSSVIYRKSGVYLTNRSPISEEIPLRSQIAIRRKSDGTCGGRTPHLVMKKSPSPPLNYTKNLSPGTPPTEERGIGGNKINRNAIAIHTNPICNTATYCEVHGSTKCTHGFTKTSNHLVKRENSKSPRTSPQISPSTSTPANLGSHEAHVLNLRNGNSSCTTAMIEADHRHAMSAVAADASSLMTVALPEVNKDVTASQSGNVAGTSTAQKVAVAVGTVGEGGQLGTLHFRLRYREENATLVVTVVKCEHLPSNACDPYIKLQLLPEREKQQRVKTRVLRAREPVYDEDFTFYGIPPSQLQEMSLHFVVLSFDRYSRDDVIGEVFYTLEDLDIEKAATSPLNVAADIQPRNYKMQSQGRGEVLLSLCWQPSACRLTVVVLKARNLPKMDVSGLADPYAKLSLWDTQTGQRLAKKKTHVKKKTLNPVFNESFVFDLPPATQSSNLDKVSLQISLLDWDRVTKNEVIGKLEIGSGSSSQTATHHWNEVVNCPRRQIAEWHKLRD